MTAEATRVLALADAASDDEDDDEDAQGREKKPSASDEAVFAQSYIPRALDQVYDPERDVARVLRGEGTKLIYADITGVATIEKARRGEEDAKGVHFAGDENDAGEEDAGSSGESGSESGSESDEDEHEDRKPRGKKHEDRDEKKVRHFPPLLLPSSTR